jgi:hypothetical protein
LQAFRGINWSELPHGLTQVLISSIPRLADDIVVAIQREIPDFSASFEDTYRQQIRTGAHQALNEFISRVSRPSERPWPSPAAMEIYRGLGRVEMQKGRSLDALHAAFRLGARLAWRRWTHVGIRLGANPAEMYRLADAVFAYMDELARLTAQGYNQALIDSAGERSRVRLARAVVADPPLPRGKLEELSAAAGWPLPDSVVVVALEHVTQGQAVAAPEFFSRDDILGDVEGPLPFLLMPDKGPATFDVVADIAAGHRAAVGPPVAVEDAARSLGWARELLQLSARGLGGDVSVLRCTDHLSSLALLRDEHLIRVLGERMLRPLEDLTVKQRARLSDTLLAWIETAGNAQEAAHLLGVHPQTARCRINRLKELFGDVLRDPQGRFELELALRGRRLTEGLAASRRSTARAPRPKQPGERGRP